MGIVTFSVICMAAVPNIMHIYDKFHLVIMYSMLANIEFFFFHSHKLLLKKVEKNFRNLKFGSLFNADKPRPCFMPCTSESE